MKALSRVLVAVGTVDMGADTKAKSDRSKGTITEGAPVCADRVSPPVAEKNVGAVGAVPLGQLVVVLSLV